MYVCNKHTYVHQYLRLKQIFGLLIVHYEYRCAHTPKLPLFSKIRSTKRKTVAKYKLANKKSVYSCEQNIEHKKHNIGICILFVPTTNTTHLIPCTHTQTHTTHLYVSLYVSMCIDTSSNFTHTQTKVSENAYSSQYIHTHTHTHSHTHTVNNYI